MSKTASLNRKAYREEVRRKKQQRKTMTLAVLAIGLLLVSWSVYAYTADRQVDQATLSYTDADVAHDQPIFAVHEMGDGPPIPFLPRSQVQPAILIPEKSYNFGSVGPHDVVEHKFIIRNNGNAPLTISRAYTTCGCTTAEISASVIPPGKVTEIILRFDAGFHDDAAGQTVRRGLIIENNDPGQSQAEIWIQASIRNS